MDVIHLIDHKNLRRLISDAQLDMGLCQTYEDFVDVAFKHLGPESELARVRRALTNLIETKGDLCLQPVKRTILLTHSTKQSSL